MNGGAAQTFAKIASLNTGLSGSVSGTFNYMQIHQIIMKLIVKKEVL